MKHISRLTGLLVLFLVMYSCSTSDTDDADGIEKIEREDEVPEGEAPEALQDIGVIRNITAKALVADMKPGWNLGNSFDVRSSDKTLWGNPLPTTALVDAVYNRGFRTLRLPITWGYNMGDAPGFEIQSAYLSRINSIVQHAIEKGMYVIINSHHDDEWIVPTVANAATTRLRLSRVWTQIAEHFKNYSDYLIFELLNEPRHVGTPEEWTGGTEEGRRVLNTYYQTALDAVRATGGNNALRKIMIAPYAASTLKVAWDGFEIPNEDKDVIISLHAYFPFPFALEGSDPDWGSDADKQAVDALMNRIEAEFITKDRPVVMGEWGSVGTLAIASERLKHASYYTQACLSKGIVPIVWDNGNANEFGLISRVGLSWNFPTLADAAANVN